MCHEAAFSHSLGWLQLLLSGLLGDRFSTPTRQSTILICWPKSRSNFEVGCNYPADRYSRGASSKTRAIDRLETAPMDEGATPVNRFR